MNKLYEVMIGQLLKVIDTPARAAGVDANNQPTPAVAEVSHIQDNIRVDLRNIVGQNVEEVVQKIKPTLKQGEYICSVNKINEIHG